jgi:hypothetical protein
MAWDDDSKKRPTSAMMAGTLEAYYRASLSPPLRSTVLKFDMKPVRAQYNRNKKLRNKYLSGSSGPRSATFASPASSSFTYSPLSTRMSQQQQQQQNRSGTILNISRGSEHARHGESLHLLLSMDVNEYSLHQVFTYTLHRIISTVLNCIKCNIPYSRSAIFLYYHLYRKPLRRGKNSTLN